MNEIAIVIFPIIATGISLSAIVFMIRMLLNYIGNLKIIKIFGKNT
jgi:hypothetical protein